MGSAISAGFATMPAEPSLPFGFQRLYIRANGKLVSTSAVFAGILRVVQAVTVAGFIR